MIEDDSLSQEELISLWEEDGIEKVKCPNCKYVHAISEDGEGRNTCFFCAWSVAHMIPAKAGDCPHGCTLQSVSRKEYERGME